MRPNHDAIKKLMIEHLKLSKINFQMEMVGITVENLEDINLFDIVLDLIGFPAKHCRLFMTSESGDGIILKERSKWYFHAFHLEEEEVDEFLDKLYAEYDELSQE